MNTKKQYMVPTSEVVDVEVHLMLGASADGENLIFDKNNASTLSDEEYIY